MKSALITGGAGFIGSHLLDRLLADGWKVTVADNFDPFYPPAVKCANLCAHLADPQFRLVEVDVRNLAEMRARLSSGYDVIVHLAAKTGVRPSVSDPETYEAVNVCGTRNLLELAREWGVRQFVFASSSSVYGLNPSLPWREESCEPRPISPYAATKLSGEQLGRTYSEAFGIRFLALRLFTVYGPRQRPDLAMHKFARLILRGEPVPVYGNGSTWRDYTYVDDIVSGIHAAISHRATSFELVNLGNRRAVGLLEMIHTLEEELGRKAVLEWHPDQAGDVPRTFADIQKARTLLGYEPRTGLREGLNRFVSWFRQNAAA